MEAREIVSSFLLPRSPFSLRSQSVDCLARQPSWDRLPGYPLCLLARKGGDGRRSQRKSNNREISFHRATIPTPIGQTRFLLLIKLTRATVVAAWLRKLSVFPRLARQITTKKLAFHHPTELLEGLKSGLDRLRLHPSSCSIMSFAITSLSPKSRGVNHVSCKVSLKRLYAYFEKSDILKSTNLKKR